MSQETVKYNRSFAGSVGAGFKSIFGGKGRRYYELVHKTHSRYHALGAVQKIIIDNIELGRDPKCQVRFDESFTTVSRRHAAIVKDGDGWRLIHLSKTNSTYLNGNNVSDSWYLQNGDEIQLSAGGPKLGFVVPQGYQGTVKSIPLTERMKAFNRQALRPYKTALWCLLAALLTICAVGGWMLCKQGKKNQELQDTITRFEQQSQEYEEAMKAKMDSLSKVNLDMEKQIKGLRSRVKSSQSSQSSVKSVQPVQKENKVADSGAPAPKNFSSIEQCFPFIYFIQSAAFVFSAPDGTEGELICGEDAPFLTATGFFLSDGRFVTARHVVEPWQFWHLSDTEGFMQQLNAIVSNGGTVDCYFNCFSPTGDVFQCKSSDFRVNRAQDQVGTYENGYKWTQGAIVTDFAYMKTGRSSGLAFDDVQCDHLKVKTELTILGFPLNEGVNGINDIKPIYSNATVGAEGLQKGRILTTGRNTDHGNSGGPVFYTDDSGNLVVVGLVSGGRGEMIGNIIPMSKVR